MFKRSNKRGPGVAVQMMRCDESQSAIIRELIDADEDVTAPTVGVGPTPNSCRTSAGNGASPGRGGGGDGGGDGAGAAATTSGAASDGHGSPAGTSPLSTAALTFTGRAQRMAIGDLRKIAELGTLGGALDLEDRENVTVHNTVRILAKFEWGAEPSLQHLRASERFFGRSWYSFVRYVSTDGSTRWGRLRLVLRSVGAERRSCVVLQRMRRAAHRESCVLTRHGCVRLRWYFATADDE